jgi:hypothetical protein
MNKKYLNSILIVLLALIWGGVIYKYFVKKKTVLPENALQSKSMAIDYTIAKDTFVLRLNNRDPFKASKRRRVQSNTTQQAKSSSNRAKQPKKALVWPNIQYYGFVKSAQNKTRKAHVKINGRLHRKRERETIDNVKLVKVYSDSIIVMFNREKKTVRRK